MNPRVIEARPQPSYHLLLTFENREIRLFDVNPYLNVGLFSELKDEEMFNTAKVFLGTVTWDNGLDLCPDTLYLEGRKIG